MPFLVGLFITDVDECNDDKQQECADKEMVCIDQPNGADPICQDCVEGLKKDDAGDCTGSTPHTSRTGTVYTQTRARARARIQPHTHTDAHTYMYTNTYTYTYTYAYAYAYAYIHARKHTHMIQLTSMSVGRTLRHASVALVKIVTRGFTACRINATASLRARWSGKASTAKVVGSLHLLLLLLLTLLFSSLLI